MLIVNTIIYKARILLINLLILFISVTLTLIFLEIIAKVYVGLTKEHLPLLQKCAFYQENVNSVYKFDRKLGWRLKPNYYSDTIQTNGFGFRSSTDYSPEKLKNKESILLLGDSMIFGKWLAQEKIFSEILNKRNANAMFINTGLEGYSPLQEFLTLEDTLKWHIPDIVVIFFFQPNDLLQNYLRDYFYPSVTLGKEGLSYMPAEDHYKIAFYKRTTLYRLLSEKFLVGKDISYLINKLDCVFRGRNSYPWKIQAKIYEKISTLAHRYNFRVVIVDIPPRQEVGRRQYYLKASRHRILADLCSEHGFGYFNLLRYYPKKAENLFLSRGEYWNESGHRFIADFLASEVLHLP